MGLVAFNDVADKQYLQLHQSMTFSMFMCHGFVSYSNLPQISLQRTASNHGCHCPFFASKRKSWRSLPSSGGRRAMGRSRATHDLFFSRKSWCAPLSSRPLSSMTIRRYSPNVCLPFLSMQAPTDHIKDFTNKHSRIFVMSDPNPSGESNSTLTRRISDAASSCGNTLEASKA